MYVYDANFYHKIPDIPVIFLNPSIELTPVLVAKDLFDRALQAPKSELLGLGMLRGSRDDFSLSGQDKKDMG